MLSRDSVVEIIKHSLFLLTIINRKHDDVFQIIGRIETCLVVLQEISLYGSRDYQQVIISNRNKLVGWRLETHEEFVVRKALEYLYAVQQR